MSTLPKFFFNGLFPCSVKELTTAQIAAYTGRDPAITTPPLGSTGAVITKITGLTLQEAWQIWWMPETVSYMATVKGYNSSGGMSSNFFQTASTTIGTQTKPPRRVCQNDGMAYINYQIFPAIGTPSSPPLGSYVTVLNYGIYFHNYIEDWSTIGGAPYYTSWKWGAVVKNTDDGAYAVFMNTQMTADVYWFSAGGNYYHVGVTEAGSGEFFTGCPTQSFTLFGKTVDLYFYADADTTGAKGTLTDPTFTFFTP